MAAQIDALSAHLLFLSAQRTAHDKLLGHDMGNSFRCSKAAGDDVFLLGSLYNRSFGIFLVAGLASVVVVDKSGKPLRL